MMFMTTITASPTLPMVKMERGMRSLLTVSQRVIQPRRRIRKKRKVATLRSAFVRYLEELLGVQEHGVNLHHQAETAISNILSCADGNAKASDHHEVMQQQLIGGPLSVVYHHIQGII